MLRAPRLFVLTTGVTLRLLVTDTCWILVLGAQLPQSRGPAAQALGQPLSPRLGGASLWMWLQLMWGPLAQAPASRRAGGRPAPSLHTVPAGPLAAATHCVTWASTWAVGAFPPAVRRGLHFEGRVCALCLFRAQAGPILGECGCWVLLERTLCVPLPCLSPDGWRLATSGCCPRLPRAWSCPRGPDLPSVRDRNWTGLGVSCPSEHGAPQFPVRHQLKEINSIDTVRLIL